MDDHELAKTDEPMAFDNSDITIEANQRQVTSPMIIANYN